MAGILKPFGNILTPGPLQVPKGRLVIDWSNRLANGLIGVWVFGANGTVDITGQAPTLTYESASGVYDQTREGAGLKSAAANTALTATATPAFKGLAAATLYWRGYVIGNSSNSCDFIGITFDNAATSPFWEIGIGAMSSGSTTSMQLEYSAGGSPQTASANHALTAGTIESLCATFGGTTQNIFYANGVQTASNAVGFSPSSSATSEIFINTYPSTGRFSNTITLAAYFWNRALSPDEVAWLNLNPYSFLLPAEYELPTGMAGAAGAVQFRRTLSELGTRAGSRQRQAA